MIKAVIFDMDDTLYAERSYLISGFERIGKYLKAEYNIEGGGDRLLELFDKEKENVYGRYLEEVNRADDFQLLGKMVELYRTNKPDKLDFYPDVEPLFSYLRDNNIRIGIITDGRIDGQRNKVEALNLEEFADKIMLTESLGESYRKPHPKSFELMAESFGIKYEEMLYVGDNPVKDFAISRNYPIITVEIIRSLKIHNNKDYLNGILPRYKINSLSEIKEVIGMCMEEPIRILQMTGTLGYAGIETVMMNLYRNIDKIKVQFDFVVCNSADRFDDEVERLGGRIYRLPSRSRHPLAYHNQLTKLLREKKEYRIFHCNTNSASAVIDLLAAKRAGVKCLIEHSHNASCLVKWQHFLFKPILKMIKKYKIACSDLAAKWMFGSSRNVVVLNNGIDLTKLSYNVETRNRLRLEMNVVDKLVIGHVGSFQARKNQKFLIDVLKCLNLANSELWFIGDGETRAEVAEYAVKQGVADKVKFLGLVNNVSELLQAMDVFAFPSTFEGLPLAAIEAQASGLLTIISDRVAPEVIVSDNAILLSIETVEPWVKHINQTIGAARSKVDEQIIAHEYDISRQSKFLEEFYISQYNNKKNAR